MVKGGLERRIPVPRNNQAPESPQNGTVCFFFNGRGSGTANITEWWRQRAKARHVGLGLDIGATPHQTDLVQRD